MGWYCQHGSTRKSTIEELTKGWEDTKNGRGLRIVAKQFKGTPFSGVLYAVGQPYKIGATEEIKDRFILVVLLKYWKNPGGWAYKDMDESFHPYNYSCPMKYLEMTPTVQNQTWRDCVKEYWANQKAKRAAKKAAKMNMEFA